LPSQQLRSRLFVPFLHRGPRVAFHWGNLLLECLIPACRTD
jgi:hypothetical protein